MGKKIGNALSAIFTGLISAVLYIFVGVKVCMEMFAALFNH